MRSCLSEPARPQQVTDLHVPGLVKVDEAVANGEIKRDHCGVGLPQRQLVANGIEHLVDWHQAELIDLHDVGCGEWGVVSGMWRVGFG